MPAQTLLKERPQVLFRENTRAPLEAPVLLQFDSYADPEKGFTADVSLGGMFVRNRNPKPVGTILKFEVELQTDTASASGFAEVAWIRVKQTGLEKPSGMGIQFRYVDADNRRLLERAVRKAVRELQMDRGRAAAGPEPCSRCEVHEVSEPRVRRRPTLVTGGEIASPPEPAVAASISSARVGTPPAPPAERTGAFGLSMGALALIIPLTVLALGLFLLL